MAQGLDGMIPSALSAAQTGPPSAHRALPARGRAVRSGRARKRRRKRRSVRKRQRSRGLCPAGGGAGALRHRHRARTPRQSPAAPSLPPSFHSLLRHGGQRRQPAGRASGAGPARRGADPVAGGGRCQEGAEPGVSRAGAVPGRGCGRSWDTGSANAPCSAGREHRREGRGHRSQAGREHSAWARGGRARGVSPHGPGP